jgi:hypothetical protein
VLTHRELVQIQRKGYRSGAWRKLNGLDRSFFRVSILYSGLNDKIVNSRILTQLKNIIDELTSTFREKIIRVSFERTRKMIGTFEEREVFSWAPELRAWLDRPEFLFWMGVTFG